jgi:hypothetical protein
MPVATAVLRPQRVRRARLAEAGGDGRLAADFLALTVRLAEDAAAGGELSQAFRVAFEAATARQLARAGEGAEAARARLEAWVGPFVAPLTTFFTGTGPVGGPAEAAEAAEALLDGIAAAMEQVDAALLRPHLQVFFDAVQVDLGLTPQVLEALVWELLEEVVARIRALPPSADRAVEERRRETVAVLRRIRRRLEGRFAIPFPTAEQAAALLAAWLGHTGTTVKARRAACAGRGLADVAGAVGRVAQAVPLVTGFGSVGAAAASSQTYAWYASWLLGKDVYVSADRTRVFVKDGEVLHTGTALRWFDAPLFTPHPGTFYSFGAVGAEAMETLAYVTGVGQHALELVLHLVSLERGDYASNAMNAGIKLLPTLYSAIAREPLSPVLDWVFGAFLTFCATFEGMHSRASALNKFTFWLTLAAPDFGEWFILKMAAGSGRDAVLSFFTLINHQKTPASGATPELRAENRRVTAGVSALVGQGAGKLMMLIYPRQDYCQPFSSGIQALKVFLLWNGLVNTVFTVFGYYAGEMLTWALSRDPDGARLSERLLGVWATSMGSFLISLYMDGEGNTDKGRWNQTGGAAFAGYPDAATSPYRLPYPKDQESYVPQGNQGFWSHNSRTVQQVYAYDFGLDQDAPILASRPGTVVEFKDDVDDDTSGDGWNYIVIRHDLDDAGNPLTALHAHDKGAGGADVVTFAVYGHGRKHSIREAFQERGVAFAAIPNSRVLRGHKIMRSGDTGMSFHNHLHMHVCQERLPRPAGAAISAAVRDASFTIPFVFTRDEVKHLFGPDGVCRTFDFYKSANQPVP